MTDMLDKYPVPWKVIEQKYIEAANGKTFVIAERSGFDLGLLQFVVETVNNSVKPKITDQPCACICGWQGIVLDCLPDVDSDGSLGCPECETVIEI